MSALEREIIEKFRHLQPEAKQRVLETLSSEKPITFDYAAWWTQVETLQDSIRSRIGAHAPVGALFYLTNSVRNSLSHVVLDSSIFISSVFPEMLTAKAKGLLHQLEVEQIALHAPSLLHYELIAVARKAVYRGRITPEEGRIARDQMLSYPVTLHFDRALLKRGYELAEEYDRPTAYDMQYLALAERLSCDFWTADERLFNVVSAKLPSIRSLGDWAP